MVKISIKEPKEAEKKVCAIFKLNLNLEFIEEIIVDNELLILFNNGNKKKFIYNPKAEKYIEYNDILSKVITIQEALQEKYTYDSIKNMVEGRDYRYSGKIILLSKPALQGKIEENLLNEVLTIHEVAEYKNKDTSTIRRIIKGKEFMEYIDYRKALGVWLIRKESIDKFYR